MLKIYQSIVLLILLIGDRDTTNWPNSSLSNKENVDVFRCQDQCLIKPIGNMKMVH